MTQQPPENATAEHATGADQAAGAGDPAAPVEPIDPSRRQFFRRFAGDMLTSAAQVVGVVADLRDRSAAEASALLGEPISSAAAAGPPPSGVPDREIPIDGPPTGFRTPFRFESDNILLVIDQRELPDALVEVPVRSASDAANAIRLMIVRGAPAIGQVAAIGIALSARIAARSDPNTRRAIIEGAANMLRRARPTAVNLRWAVDRLLARYHAMGDLSPDGEAIAAALDEEAMAIVAEATDDHGRLAEAGLAVLPVTPDRPLSILTHCNTGPLACGQFGTAMGIVQVAHHAERSLHVWVNETRPYLQGARLTAWELQQAGVPHTLIPDMAAGALMARGEVDVVLVGADRIAANGDTANKLGTYTLAVLAARHGIPFIVCAPLSSVDLDTPDGSTIPIEDRAADEVTLVRGVRIAPEGTAVRNPSFDVTPAELIGAIVTEEGVLGAPYGPALRAAMDRRDARRSRAAASGAEAAAEPAERAGPAESVDATEPVERLDRAEVTR
ncbi:MAG TPA: S-methyl-5-thioribose-1-phosphate isomerase [Candidatus Limnocylindria bacterium]|nr:S-methyl-5-thioribose-1-phosphate isomerase [Candidatus Limnocylindria bacterium]